MARTNPFPKRERQICRRVRETREALGLTRLEFGEAAGVDSNLITNYEHGKAQLNYPAAHKIIKAFGINPQWLATGEGPRTNWVSWMPGPEVLKVGIRALFSRVYDEFLVRGGTEIVPNDDDYRVHLEWILRGRIEDWVSGLSTDSLQWLDEAVGELDLLRRHKPHDNPEVVKARLEMLRRRRPHVEDIVDMIAEFEQKQKTAKQAEEKRGAAHSLLTDSSEYERLASDVKIPPQWPELKKRLQKALEKTGARAALVKFLNVDPTQVSQWLSESKSAREPGGEYTLQMLKWVELQERKT